MKKESLRIFFAEAFGVCLLCFGGGLININFAANKLKVGDGVTGEDIDYSYALLHAIGAAMLIYLAFVIVFPITGCHINPVVTLSFFLTYRIDKVKAIYYICAQITGSLFSGFMLLIIRLESKYGEITGTETWEKVGLGEPNLNYFKDDKGSLTGQLFLPFVCEFTATFLLVFVIYSLAIHQKLGAQQVALGVAAVIFVCSLTMGKFTGPCLNPARILGPAFFNGSIFESGSWIYYAATILGGVAGGASYDFLILKAKDEIEDFEEEGSYELEDDENAKPKKKIQRQIELSVTEQYEEDDFY